MSDIATEKLLTESETFTFGDSEELSSRLLQLVREGKKTATCGALRDYGPHADAMPVVGRQDIALTMGRHAGGGDQDSSSFSDALLRCR